MPAPHQSIWGDLAMVQGVVETLQQLILQQSAEHQAFKSEVKNEIQSLRSQIEYLHAKLGQVEAGVTGEDGDMIRPQHSLSTSPTLNSAGIPVEATGHHPGRLGQDIVVGQQDAPNVATMNGGFGSVSGKVLLEVPGKANLSITTGPGKATGRIDIESLRQPTVRSSNASAVGSGQPAIDKSSCTEVSPKKSSQVIEKSVSSKSTNPRKELAEAASFARSNDQETASAVVSMKERAKKHGIKSEHATSEKPEVVLEEDKSGVKIDSSMPSNDFSESTSVNKENSPEARATPLPANSEEARRELRRLCLKAVAEIKQRNQKDPEHEKAIINFERHAAHARTERQYFQFTDISKTLTPPNGTHDLGSLLSPKTKALVLKDSQGAPSLTRVPELKLASATRKLSIPNVFFRLTTSGLPSQVGHLFTAPFLGAELNLNLVVPPNVPPYIEIVGRLSAAGEDSRSQWSSQVDGRRLPYREYSVRFELQDLEDPVFEVGPVADMMLLPTSVIKELKNPLDVPANLRYVAWTYKTCREKGFGRADFPEVSDIMGTRYGFSHDVKIFLIFLGLMISSTPSMIQLWFLNDRVPDKGRNEVDNFLKRFKKVFEGDVVETWEDHGQTWKKLDVGNRTIWRL